ncbi:hypothetical protein HY968_02360 [Candidatus Kaiserbacteria bacterium]|nr:hypothetical protein [Candidatus Kaiserbacteria bacterium]
MTRFLRYIPYSIFLIPFSASAHEVYVLDSAAIMRDIVNPSPNPLALILQDPQQFLFWALIGAILISTVFTMSITHRVQDTFSPFLMRLKPWAAPIARVTLGACLIASAYNNALFGPELPFSDFGTFGRMIQITLYISGILSLVGLWTRAAGSLALLIFAAGIAKYNIYMFTYANYLGEIFFAMILGSGRFSLDHWLNLPKMARFNLAIFAKLGRRLEPYAFPVLRILFGISIAFASYYAKFVHSQLALDVVTKYHLTNFFHFDPLFIVLGAFCVELLIGLFLILGVEIRHTALFFLFWLALSLLYFGEAVWPHLVLVGVLLALFCHGYDKLSLEGYYFKRGSREPVL